MTRRLAATTILLIAFSAIALDAPALGVLASSGASVNNFTTAAPFTNITGVAKVSIQCSAASCYTGCSTGSACSVTCTLGQANTGMQLAATALPYQVTLPFGTNAIAIIPVTGSANCQINQVSP